ncbi:MAG TPA: hypothetical protein VEI54_05335 [Candidatus Limnocylindrales bacterium]|nr:hypothetical protein [Candidatus Limnocylindrales bacterium]
MNKEEKIAVLRKRFAEHNEAWLAWSDQAAALSVDELLIAKLIQPDQADFARRIVAQQLHVLLVSGSIPPN